MSETSLRHRRRERHAEPAAAVAAPHLAPRLSMLREEDCQRLHAASCHILERTGFRVYHEGALKLLRQSGARVEGDRVWLTQEMVDAAIASAPRSFNLHRRGGQEVGCILDGEHVYFGPGSDTLRYLDPRSAAIFAWRILPTVCAWSMRCRSLALQCRWAFRAMCRPNATFAINSRQ